MIKAKKSLGQNFLFDQNIIDKIVNIREIEKYDFVEIGNHSHTHEYLIDYTDAEIENDLKTSINIFKENSVLYL